MPLGSTRTIAISANRTFQLYGTQTWGIQSYPQLRRRRHGRDLRDPGGTFYTGSFSRMVFAMDHDVASATGESVFSNISISDAAPPPPPVTQLNVMVDTTPLALDVLPYGFDQDRCRRRRSRYRGGRTLSMVGNAWKQVQFNCTVGAATTLSFDFSSGTQGEIHGIGFDKDDGISANRTFQLYGTQTWGIQSTHNYAGGVVMDFRFLRAPC